MSRMSRNPMSRMNTIRSWGRILAQSVRKKSPRARCAKQGGAGGKPCRSSLLRAADSRLRLILSGRSYGRRSGVAFPGRSPDGQPAQNQVRGFEVQRWKSPVRMPMVVQIRDSWFAGSTSDPADSQGRARPSVPIISYWYGGGKEGGRGLPKSASDRFQRSYGVTWPSIHRATCSYCAPSVR